MKDGGVARGNVQASIERAREELLQEVWICLGDGYLKCNYCDENSKQRLEGQ